VNNTVSAITVRKNLGEYLNKAFYKGEETLVERKGKIVAKIVPVNNLKTSKKPVLAYAGIWRNKKDISFMKNEIASGRITSSRSLKPL
jgi:antitoxin (DNA-binding transcriptional repressor) of toxin-antitoxin stability system